MRLAETVFLAQVCNLLGVFATTQCLHHTVPVRHRLAMLFLDGGKVRFPALVAASHVSRIFASHPAGQVNFSPRPVPTLGPEPTVICALEGTRTPNLLIRSQMLYPLSYKRLGDAF